MSANFMDGKIADLKPEVHSFSELELDRPNQRYRSQRIGLQRTHYVELHNYAYCMVAVLTFNRYMASSTLLMVKLSNINSVCWLIIVLWSLSVDKLSPCSAE